ncbi:MAG TPA: CDP-diacylglycerol--serine O-phosphatidyltransferase [Gemmatimonadales bacterium]|nr:CDP-diacylglycerol--serine O-phosphatidyltransferase [Gemmatimonadales bacterium]
MTQPLQPLPRPRGMRRVVHVAPSAFTLGNLFFGIWSIVSSARGNFAWAGWFIVLAAVLDGLDGRLARLSKTSSRFGAELDSLVDVISFGVAPALLMYHLEFQQAGRFAWVICYIFIVAVALRLARFNVMVGSTPVGWFTGLPSPAAGGTLAVYYPFSQTRWYQEALNYVDLQRDGLVFLMILLAVLMLSTVKYPKSPRISVRSARGIFGLVVYLAILAAIIVSPSSFMFPMALSYIAYGILRFTILSFLDRQDRLALMSGGVPPGPARHEEERHR